MEVKMTERDFVLGNVVQAMNLISKNSAFSLLIPEVRSNIAFALPVAKTRIDVAAITGRITVVNGFPYASGYPDFGASSHLARLLIEVTKTNPEIRAVINFIYNDEFGIWLKEYCRKNSLVLGCINREAEPEELKAKEGASMPWKVKSLIEATGGKVPDIAFETGAVGKEPVSVLLGKTALEVTEKIIKLGDEYVKNR